MTTLKKTTGSPFLTLVSKKDVKSNKRSSKRWAKRDANKPMAANVQSKFDNMTPGEFEDWKENQKEAERMSQRPSSLR